MQLSETMRVMTFNIAHGRAGGFHQALMSRARIQANLQAIAGAIEREGADVVALQEADGPSLWSGRFDHVQFLAQAGRFVDCYRGAHVCAMALSYGTALLSRRPLADSASVTFAPSFPTPSKGFVVSSVEMDGRAVDVVSLHLDFARRAVRARQLAELAATLKRRGRPRVVMGDFNCQFNDPGSPLPALAAELELSAYRPDALDLATFPAFRSRLDWILISRDLDFASHRTLGEPLSDHQAVIAELVLRP